jgi:hypothetical protein
MSRTLSLIPPFLTNIPDVALNLISRLSAIFPQAPSIALLPFSLHFNMHLPMHVQVAHAGVPA